MATPHPLDPDEWDLVLGQMLKYHQNISDEIRDLIAQIRREMKPELVPMAEDRANYGKLVKKAIRSMWALEYEIEEIQTEFIKQLGHIDLNNLTDDFVEDCLLQSKPLQGVLHSIREKQKVKMDSVKKEYGEHISGLEPLKVPRPPKPPPKPEEPELKKDTEKKPSPSEPVKETKPTEQAQPAVVEAAPTAAAEEVKASDEPPVDSPEPAAIEPAAAPQAVEASA